MERLINSKASFLLYFLLAVTLWSPSVGGDTLTPHQPLADDGRSLISAGAGSFELGFFSPVGSNNRYVGIWYPNISPQTVVWVANRQRPVTGRSGSLSITTNGTLVVTDGNSTIVWSSSSPALANPVAELLDDGNFVVRDFGGSSSDPNSFAWQSFDLPTDTLLPGMKLGWNLTSGLNRNLTAWSSASDPTPSAYTAGVDFHGDPQLLIWSGTQPYWRGGPWNGIYFTGIPANADKILQSEFVVDSHQVIYQDYYLRERSIVSRLVMDHLGTLQRLEWREETQIWDVVWFAPGDQCDNVSPCGFYGLCNPDTDSPLCACVQGFHPKNPTNWDLRDGYSDGCVRTTALDCWNGTDGFLQQSNVKLPDTSISIVDSSMSLEQCRALCLKNCSCTAYASANISGSGSGCIIWTTELADITVYSSGRGQDLYVRIAKADLDSKSRHSHRNHVVVITVVVVILAIFLLACVGCCVRKMTGISGTSSFREQYIVQGTDARDLELPLFDLGTIVDATDNFSTDNKLGEGGFGPVYKGKLGEEQEIAVKRLSELSCQGLDEFKNEVTLIAKLQHRSLVRLLGCCIQAGERMLVYEYMPNGSLDAFLFDKAKGALLDWRTRHNIIIGIARGLLYLHQDSRLRIIHRDLKASNILLDKNMNPKISDFGMARIFGGDETEANTRRVVGTYGYMPPEYVMDGIFSVKFDVFSFGVLVLEIVTGKRNRGVYHSRRHLNLLGYAWSLWNEDKGSELVDESIGYSFPMVEALRCIRIGLLCVQEWPEHRPTMSTVLLMLSSKSELPRPKQPGFVVVRGTAETDSSMSNLSANNASITILEGR